MSHNCMLLLPAFSLFLPAVSQPTDSSLEDVKKLKVCIELNGLRLNKPHLAGELRQWPPSGQRSAEVDRKLRMDAGGRAEVSGGWPDRTPAQRNEPKGKTWVRSGPPR